MSWSYRIYTVFVLLLFTGYIYLQNQDDQGVRLINTARRFIGLNSAVITNRTTEGLRAMQAKIDDLRYATYQNYNGILEPEDNSLLFFWTKNCSTCEIANKDISAHLTEMPKDLHIFLVDMDFEVPLVRRYHVEKPHTFVYINPKEEEISRWVGGGYIEIMSKVWEAKSKIASVEAQMIKSINTSSAPSTPSDSPTP